MVVPGLIAVVTRGAGLEVDEILQVAHYGCEPAILNAWENLSDDTVRNTAMSWSHRLARVARGRGAALAVCPP